MGRLYAFKLYFPISRLVVAFAATQRIADLEFHHSTEVMLPKHKTIQVPFSLQDVEFLNHNTSRLFPGDTIHTDLVLYFPIDDAIREFCGVFDTNIREGIYHTRLGAITLFVTAGKHFVEFSFGATGNSISFAFANSASIQSTILDILRNGHGIVGLFDTETIECDVLGSPGKKILLDYDDYNVDDLTREFKEVHDIDRKVEDILAQL